MAKNINIHVKTRGAHQTKRQLDEVGRGAKRVGSETEKMGAKSSRASKWITAGLAKIAGPAGILAVIAAMVTAGTKVAKFFDNLKSQLDESISKIQALRAEFEGLYEAKGAFTEEGRAAVTKEAVSLLKETRVSKQIGLPVIEAYERQFGGLVKTGELSKEAYAQGLKGMLGYAQRHGGAATPELIALMRGWGMATPEQQGVFRRQIAAGAATSGLTDAELITALGRGMPTIKAMGWTPTQAAETIAVLAAGETGRKKASLPATTLQGLLAPQLANIEKLGISEEIGRDPQKLLAHLAVMRGRMDPKAFSQMLTQIYGTEAAAGVYKLVGAPRGGIRGALAQAAGAEGLKAETEEERTSRETLQRITAGGEAAALEESLNRTREHQYRREIRRIGAEKQRALAEYEEPVWQYAREVLTIGKEKEKEQAAIRAWVEQLSPEERVALLGEYREPLMSEYDALRAAWKAKTYEEQYEALVGTPPTPVGAGPVTINYNNNIIYHPRFGSDERGPRFTQD